MWRYRVFLFVFFLCISSMALANENTERGVMLREGIIYLTPDATSAKISNIGRGQEVAVIERTPGWIHVVGTVGIVRASSDFDEDTPKNVTGWLMDKGVITTTTPDGDQILFGEAVDSESEAERRGGRKGAAQDAYRIYFHIAEFWPTSTVAAEAAYRAADIRWQLEAADAATLPSAKERDPALRHLMNEDQMKQVIKKYPQTKWADMAAYRLLDNKMCGDWQAQAKCPEKEAELYVKYAAEHPQSPKAPEALYKAAWRYSALITIYGTDNQEKKAGDSAGRAVDTAKKLIAQYPNDTDWAERARRLVYMVQNKIPTFGNMVE